jgi:hypothetical protein
MFLLVQHRAGLRVRVGPGIHGRVLPVLGCLRLLRPDLDERWRTDDHGDLLLRRFDRAAGIRPVFPGGLSRDAISLADLTTVAVRSARSAPTPPP